MLLSTTLLALLACTAEGSRWRKRQMAGVVDTGIFPDATYPGASDPGAAAGSQSFETSAPFYPSPWGSGLDDWADAYTKARAFVSQLTLMEKVNLTTGVGWEGEQCVGNTGSIPRLNFRALCMQDSPVGVRLTDYNSVFPAGVTAAATFDKGLLYARGEAMGAEHKGKGVNVMLGPVAGPLGRAPEGGRNWEGFSPDPVLTGVAMAQTVQGIQQHVVACAKHFIGNEQEHFRQMGEAAGYNFTIAESYSSNIDDVTMHELYLWPFADAVRAGVGSVMCSYNQVNNSYACQNSKVLNNLLKDELGFQGFVMSDWQAQHTGVASALAGLDMTMPGDTLFDSGYSFWGPNLTLAVINGTMPEWRIDDMATRIMASFFKVGFTTDQPPVNFDSWTLQTYGPLHAAANTDFQQVNWHVDVRDNHAQLIRQIAAAGTVLLKNTNNALPLKKPKFVAVIGEDAGPNPLGPNGCSDRGCDNGTLGMAWGSGSANFPYLVTPDTALQTQALSDGSRYESILDNWATGQINALVSQQDVTAIVFVNADSGEGYISVDGNEGDRNNLTLWQGGDALIANVSKLCNNTIVVIHSTGPVLLTNISSNPNVTAILWAGIPGQESGNSITDVLYGRVNPAGRSPFTWGASRSDYGTDLLYEPNNGQLAPQLDFTEGIYIDYRSFQKRGITPIYSFGYGLSYTTFTYSSLTTNGSFASPYTPTTGTTAPAPVLGNFSTNLADYLFSASGIGRYVKYYIYPFLNSTDAKTASMDPLYGQTADQFLPPNALSSSPQPLLPAGGGSGGNPGLYDILFSVSCVVTNTGSVTGEEVAQLYVDLGDGVKVLRGFERVSVSAGGTATVRFDLTRRDLSRWDTVSQNWVLAGQSLKFYVGSSSTNTPLSGTLSGGSGGSGSGGSGGSGGGGSGSGTVSQISDGQPQAGTAPAAATSKPAVSQAGDGQPQAGAATSKPAVSQAGDGQPQAGAATSKPAVSQASDGQPQGQSATAKATAAAPVTQGSDGQPAAASPVTQGSDGQPAAASPVTQGSDGQPAAASPVSQAGDGQPQGQSASASAVKQTSDGQVQATAAP